MEQHWEPYAPSISKCLQIAAEAIEGEKAFQFESGELTLLRQKLGLSSVSASIPPTETINRHQKKQRPGIRQPRRDVIGES